jgi:hypothetical protein
MFMQGTSRYTRSCLVLLSGVVGLLFLVWCLEVGGVLRGGVTLLFEWFGDSFGLTLVRVTTAAAASSHASFACYSLL